MGHICLYIYASIYMPLYICIQGIYAFICFYILNKCKSRLSSQFESLYKLGNGDPGTPNYIHIQNPECLQILWVKFPFNFWLRGVFLKTFNLLYNFCATTLTQKVSKRCALNLRGGRPSICSYEFVIPQTFKGVPQKFTWCQRFGIQLQSGNPDLGNAKKAILRCFVGQ